MASSNPYANLIEQQALASGGYAALPQIQRSQYLADALKALQESAGQNIRTPGALGSNLLAAALLKYGEKRSQKSLLDALGKQSQAQVGGDMSQVFGDQTPAAPAAPAPAPSNFAAPPAPSAGAGFAQVGATPPAVDATPASGMDARTRRLVAEALYGEAGNQGETGMRAVLDVGRNRARMSGLGLDQVFTAPHQFEAMNNPRTRAKLDGLPDSALANAYGIIDNQNAPPVVGPNTTNFLNPSMQTQMGRPQPPWANGNGQRIGDHVFYEGNYQAPRGMRPNNPPPPPAPPPQMGTGGAPPVPAPPQPQGQQAPPAGSPQAAVQTELPILYGNGATPVEKAQIMQGLQAPVGSARYNEAATRLHEIAIRMSQQTPYDIQIVNGVPVAIDKDTGHLIPLAVPDAVRSRVMDASQAGINAPPGTSVVQSPVGDTRVVSQPAAGYQAANQPGQPYQERPIRGGSQDPTSGQNVVANESQLRQQYDREIAPYRLAREGYQKVLQAAQTRTPAGDIALVFGYMKTLDPNSTVREGEQASVRNSGTIDQTIANLYNQLLSGQGSLTDQQRQQFLDSAGRQFATYETTAQGLNQRYGQIASSYGFDPSRIVQRFDPVGQMAPTPVPTSRQPDGSYRPTPGINPGQQPTHSNTAAGPSRLPPGVTPQDARAQAAAAIRAGKPREAVLQRLQALGVDPSGL